MNSDDAARRIAELEHALEDAERRAATDALTGVLNRRGWDEALAREEDRCRRHELDAAVFVIDLDELKQTNSRGHAAGDDLLRRCAAALQQAVRAHDVVARVGGDEFAVLAVRADKPAAEQLGRRLRSELERAGVNATVGAACIDEGPGLGAAWELADHRMLAGKADGAAG
jgi:diguanylate cyclase (GGDEF)-like protein